jgi:hypothetical protein
MLSTASASQSSLQGRGAELSALSLVGPHGLCSLPLYCPPPALIKASGLELGGRGVNYATRQGFPTSTPEMPVVLEAPEVGQNVAMLLFNLISDLHDIASFVGCSSICRGRHYANFAGSMHIRNSRYAASDCQVTRCQCIGGIHRLCGYCRLHFPETARFPAVHAAFQLHCKASQFASSFPTDAIVGGRVYSASVSWHLQYPRLSTAFKWLPLLARSRRACRAQ